MLSQQEADALIEMLKNIKKVESPFTFPFPGECRKLDLISEDGKQSFIVDVNRKGNINFIKKCTYQGRFQKDIPLLRLDLEGPEHTNPDGELVSGNHMHIYRENFGDRFAIPVPPEIIDPNDMFKTLIDFLSYFKATNAKLLEIEMVM